MTAQRQVQQQIDQEYNKFVNSNYKGEVAIPKNIIPIFIKAVLAMPPYAHRILFQKIKSIKAKSNDDLLISDLNDIVKVLLNTAPDKLYEGSDDTIINDCIQIDNFVRAFNEAVDDFKNKLEIKKANLTSLSGSNNAMRILS